MRKTKLKLFLYIVLSLIFIGGFLKFIFIDGADDLILPIKLSSQGFPVASIKIQGHKIPLIFDNGASRTSITLSKDLVKKLNLKLSPTNKQECFFDDTGQKTCLKIHVIPEIKIGHMTKYNVPCQLMDKLWGGHYDEGFVWFEAAKNGVIGLDLLNQFNVLVDYEASRVILSKLGKYPRQYDIKKWIQIPFSDKYGVTTVAQINGYNAILVWDTGANNSIMKSTAKISTAVEKESCASEDNPHCQYFETTTFVTTNKQLPKTKFFVQENEFPFDGLIGSSFFRKNMVFFDFKNNLMFIKPYKTR